MQPMSFLGSGCSVGRPEEQEYGACRPEAARRRSSAALRGRRSLRERQVRRRVVLKGVWPSTGAVSPDRQGAGRKTTLPSVRIEGVHGNEGQPLAAERRARAMSAP